MKKLCIRMFILLLSTGISSVSLAQNFHLVKDINNSKDARPVSYSSYDDPRFITIKGINYFIADDGIHGRELWRSDGTSKGTYLVKDIYTGTGSSNAYYFTPSNNKLFFVATDVNGYGLWVSDGTAAGTNSIPGPQSIAALADLNGMLYFFDYGGNLWKSDGTASGTSIIATLSNAFVYSIYMMNLNGVLFFVAYDFTYGIELFRTDGTTEGTWLVKDINTFGDSYPQQLTTVNGKLYFSADDGSGRKLWMSDGTPEGTMLASNNNAVILGEAYYRIAHIGNILYFSGSTSTTGTELYKYNTNTSATVLIKDIASGSEGSNPQNITNVNGTLFFSATGSDKKISLWKSDGTGAGTVSVISSNTTKDYFSNFIKGNGELYFSYYNQTTGAELWKSDGTTAGTVLIKDIYPGKGSSNPYSLTFTNNQILFSANDGTTGIELWKSNGTGAGTQLIKDINQTTTSSSSPSSLVNLNNKLVFNAFENKHGAELWKSNGRFGGTSLVKDILPGPSSSYPYFITQQNNHAYFFTGNPTQLWTTDGDNGGTSFVKDFAGNYISYALSFPDAVVAANNQVFFSLFNPNTNKSELWRSNGTAQGTYLLKKDLGPYGGSSAVIKNSLFFTVITDTSAALWKSDGTVAGTVLVKSFQPNIFYEVDYLYPFDGNVFFNADDVNGYGLWKSDGTETGTVFVKNLFRPGIYGHAVSNGTLYFDADDGVNGRQLWKTDGTTAGTKLVKIIAPYGSYPQNLIDVNGILYFTATDNDYVSNAKYGRELYKTDGTKAGTQLVKDITPGIDDTNFPSSFEGRAFADGNGELYFTIYDQSYSTLTLWRSNGTKAGTKPVPDNALKNVTYVTDLTPVGPQLFFTGYSYQYGWELYAGYTSPCSALETTAANALITSSPNDGFAAKLLTNPVKDELKFTVTVKDQQSVQIMIADALGRTLKTDKQILSAGSNMFSYDAQTWSQGMYMIRIVTADGSSSLLKAVK